ncbi:hypothetical protein CY34DRAFT_531815 [Suillus luteus UH-Slu-Lm8-n1]|uniref:Uncharacterized protein n=1 Tax=Suillus luteus UH-Slu-Lm8-n1 TaxID=930992 RepID=A0A0D0AWP1_9AGAM|nr:hypothetical protein CY34DRAFT_531815 [Suillus luteus UH-Slu-Lm8-n1]
MLLSESSRRLNNGCLYAISSLPWSWVVRNCSGAQMEHRAASPDLQSGRLGDKRNLWPSDEDICVWDLYSPRTKIFGSRDHLLAAGPPTRQSPFDLDDHSAHLKYFQTIASPRTHRTPMDQAMVSSWRTKTDLVRTISNYARESHRSYKNMHACFESFDDSLFQTYAIRTGR